MKIAGLSGAFALTAQVLFAPPTQAQSGGIPGPAYTEPLGIGLEGWPYPYPVHFMPLEVRGQHLRAAFMDVAPMDPPNGRVIRGSAWREL